MSDAENGQGSATEPSAWPTDVSAAPTILLSTAIRYLDQQVTSNARLDEAIRQLATASTIVLPLVFGLLGNTLNDLSIGIAVFICAAMGAYLLVLSTALYNSYTPGIDYRPNLSVAEQHSASLSGIELEQWIVQDIRVGVEANDAMLRRKRLVAGLVMGAFFIEGVSLVLAALLTIA